MEKSLIARIARSDSPVAQYIAKYGVDMPLWDQLTFVAWLDPSIITESRPYFLDVDVNYGAAYGNTIVWFSGTNPGLGEQQVTVNLDLNVPKFYEDFVALISAPSKLTLQRR